ncbi:hypothetical protein OS128_04260 [Corynebacterium sp. P5848]|nr:hypothetical protein [Corynebacterium marambiense]
MILSLIVGTVISVNQQQISGVYLGLFAATALGCTLFVVPRGLWLTTAGVPLMFGVATPVAAWTITRSTAAEGSDAFSATGIATAIYPLAQHFPILAATTVGCILVAALRLTRVRQLQIIAERTHIQARRQITDAEHRNIATAARARSVSSRARRQKVEGDTRPTVAELRRKTMEEESARRRRMHPDSGGSLRGGGQSPRRRPVGGPRQLFSEQSQPRPTTDDRDRTTRAQRAVRSAATDRQPGHARAAQQRDPEHEERHLRPEVRRERYSVGEPARRRVQDPREQRQREDSSEYPRGPRRRPVARPQRPRREQHLIGTNHTPDAPAPRHGLEQAAHPSPTPEDTPQAPPTRRRRWLDDDLYS